MKTLKKCMQAMGLAAALGACLSVPAFAAETQEEFREEAETLYEQMQALNAQIDTLRQKNNEISQNYREIGKAYREGGTLPADEEVWDAVKEIRREISPYQSSKEDSTVKAMRAEAKAAADSGDYDGALEIMGEVVQSKQARLENVQAANALWLEIEGLLSNTL